jgi:hypothetical protein
LFIPKTKERYSISAGGVFIQTDGSYSDLSLNNVNKKQVV